MKNTRRKRLSVSMLLMVSAIVLGGCSDTTESSSKTVKGLELSDYIGMTEATFLAETGFEKNDYGTYPDMEHAAVMCLDGQVYSLMINQYDADNTFMGYSINIPLDDLDDLVSDYTLIDSSETEGGTRNTYMTSEYDACLGIDVDDDNKVFGIYYTLVDEDTAETITNALPSATETSESDITYFSDNDMRETTCSYTYWDEESSVDLDLTYTGQKNDGTYVGNCTFHMSYYDYETEQTDTIDASGTFVEDTSEYGTITFESGAVATYYLYWDNDHYSLTLDLDGTTIYLLDANWAYDNVG